MAASTLQSFVNGMRQMLTLQLFVGVAAVALAGWTAAVTNEVIRERDALKGRVAQLETEIGILGGEIPDPIEAIEVEEAPPVEEAANTEDSADDVVVTEETTRDEVTPSPVVDTPAFQSVVLHIFTDLDRDEAEGIARDLDGLGLKTSIELVPRNVVRRAFYSYSRREQQQAAGNLHQRIRDIARRRQIAAWNIDMRATLNADAPADQFDIWLPTLPQRDAEAPNNLDSAEAEPEREQSPDARVETRTDAGSILRDLFTPPPAVQLVVLHVAEADRDAATRVARQLSASGARVSIEVKPANDQRQSGYAYYDLRQNRAADGLARQLRAIAQQNEIGPWAADLDGVLLPPSAEFAATRVDFVLPPARTAGPNRQILRDVSRAPNAVTREANPPPQIR